MTTLLYSLAALAVLFGVVPILLARRLKHYLDRFLTAKSDSGSTGRDQVSIIAPCKGIDPGFEDNIVSFLEQDYPNFEIIFVTATEDDPAAARLDKLISQYPQVRAKRVVAGISSKRAQKLTNLIHAVGHVDSLTTILAFVDSDIRPRPQYVGDLVSPLKEGDIGATTGMRWYLPTRRNLGSLLRSIWTIGGITMQIDNRSSFTWGGSFALRKETWGAAAIAEVLDKAVSDSFGVTRAIKALGQKIHFVPECVAVSHENSTFAETLEWTNRQTIISRVYNPPFWWMVFLTYSFSNAMLLLGVVLVIFSVFGSAKLLFPGVLMLSVIPLQIVNVATLLPSMERMLPEHALDIDRLKYHYYLVTPLTSILMLLNSLVSMVTNEISWRGIRYRLVSPTETIVKAGP